MKEDLLKSYPFFSKRVFPQLLKSLNSESFLNIMMNDTQNIPMVYENQQILDRHLKKIFTYKGLNINILLNRSKILSLFNNLEFNKEIDLKTFKQNYDNLVKNFLEIFTTEETYSHILSEPLRKYLPRDIVNMIETPELINAYPVYRILIEEPVNAVIMPLMKNLFWEPLKRVFAYHVWQLLRVYTSLTFQLDVRGFEHIPARGGFILTPNHRSFLDGPILLSVVERKLYFTAAKEFFEVPIMRELLDFFDTISIKRGEHDIRALNKCAEILANNHGLVIFPEGTIPGIEDSAKKEHIDPKTGLLPGHSGVIRLAISTKTPIIPVGIAGTDRALPIEAMPLSKQPWVIKPTKIMVNIGEPIIIEQQSDEEVLPETIKELTDFLMERISELYREAECLVPRAVKGERSKVKG